MSRRATLKDVAAAAGVAVVTVSRVVNSPDAVNAHTRDRVQRAMRRLGYSPNLAARSMRTQHTRSIGFLTPALSSASNAAVAQACEQALAAAGYAMLVTSSGHSAEREVSALGLLRARGVDGVVLYLSDQTHDGLLRALRDLDLPVVVLDRDLPWPCDAVMSEHAPPMAQALRQLAALGHERFALVRHTQRIRPGQEREAAFRRTLKALRLPAGRVLRVPRAEPAPALDASLVTGADAPTAWLAEGTLLLRTVLLALRQAGHRVPRDRSVIGIDTQDAANLTTPPTTSIVRDFTAIGQAAAALMLARLADPARLPQRVDLESRLLEGGSCAAAPRSPRGPDAPRPAGVTRPRAR